MDTKGDLALVLSSPPHNPYRTPPKLTTPNRQFERLAVARLQYTVNELQTKVDYDRRLSAPVRKFFHCVTDDSALVQSIADFKKWTGEGAVSMTVPLCSASPPPPPSRVLAGRLTVESNSSRRARRPQKRH